MKITAATVIAKVKHATLFSVSYIDRHGTEKQWHLVSRKKRPKCIGGNIHRADATIIIPYHPQTDQLVVIREFRIPLGDYQYGFPAGLLDPDEDLKIAAARELKEETGFTLEKIYRHSPAIFSSAGITDESIAMVFAEVSGVPSNEHNKASEEIDIFMMDRKQIRVLLNSEDIIFGARSWLVMDAFANFGVDYLRAV